MYQKVAKKRLHTLLGCLEDFSLCFTALKPFYCCCEIDFSALLHI